VGTFGFQPEQQSTLAARSRDQCIEKKIHVADQEMLKHRQHRDAATHETTARAPYCNAMLGDRGMSNSDMCSSSQGLHDQIQATVMPEINTKINQSIAESEDPELPELATPGVECFYELAIM
jgi:hypothetical protein